MTMIHGAYLCNMAELNQTNTVRLSGYVALVQLDKITQVFPPLDMSVCT